MVTAPQPAATEQDQAKWLAYYRNLFVANNGVVLAPSETTIAAQRQAYQQASAEWRTRNDRTSLKQAARDLVIGGVLGLVVLYLFFRWLGSGA